jgi:hypothetical protein
MDKMQLWLEYMDLKRRLESIQLEISRITEVQKSLSFIRSCMKQRETRLKKRMELNKQKRKIRSGW